MIPITEANIREKLSKVSGIYAIRFYSPTCGPCHTMKPVFDHLEKNNPSLSFFEVDSSLSPTILAHFNIEGVPALLFCHEADTLYSFIGVTPLATIQNVLNQLTGPSFKEHGIITPLETRESQLIYVVVVIILLSYGAIWYFT